MITVTTPSGITTQTTTTTTTTSHVPRTISHPPRDIPGFGPNLAQPFAFPGINTPSGPPTPLAPINPLSRSITPQQPFQGPHTSVSFDRPFSPGVQQTQNNAAALLGNLNNKNPVEKQPQGEFNHAIQYLNKIKARYSDDTNTYKQFLDILQAYQKEQRHLQDVSILFFAFGLS